MATSIKVIVTRPLMYRGERRERNEVLTVSPADAWQLCSGGRAELRDPRDGAAVKAAVQAEVAATLKAEGRPWDMRSEADGGPWRRA